MALDFHLVEENYKPPNKQPVASFELQPHELIFFRFGLPEGKFPLFKRMEDYYNDSKYSLNELQYLINEIEEIHVMYGSNEQLSEQLSSILVACKQALNEKSNILVFCD